MRLFPAAMALLLALGTGTVPLVAQAVPSDSAGAVADSARGLGPLARAGRAPVSPKGAALRSLILPGWGQFAAKRPIVGAAFVASEAVFVGLVLREQQRIRDLEASGADSAASAARRQKREDWIVLGLVNHLASAIEAYVAAYLWDFPDELKVRALPGGGVRAQVVLPLRVP